MLPKTKTIYLYVPNIIGYIRISLLLATVYSKGFIACIFYFSSAALDFLDGYMARLLNQSTTFGSCFDMMVDRLSTCVIIIKIIAIVSKNSINNFNINYNSSNDSNYNNNTNYNDLSEVYVSKNYYKNMNIFKNLLITLYCLDFISHFFHFNLSLMIKKHHKSENSNFLIRLYYNKPFLFTICSLEQICFVLLYYFSFNIKYFSPLNYNKIYSTLMLPYIVKSVFHMVQLVEALKKFEKLDNIK